MEKTATQVTLEDLRALLADVPMPPLTRHWVDEHLDNLERDAKAGELSDEKAELEDELESELEDLSFRLAAARGRWR